jgi:hypothetical protein
METRIIHGLMMKSTIALQYVRARTPFKRNAGRFTSLKSLFSEAGFGKGRLAAWFWLLAFLAAGLPRGIAQPTLISTVPSNGTTGVSPSAAVVFTFSTAMNTNSAVTYAVFFDESFRSLNTIQTWNSTSNILTCAPSPPFPSPQIIDWSLAGRDAVTNLTATGSFSTGQSAGAALPILTNAIWTAGAFSFDILTSTGQMVTVVSSTNVRTALSSWPVLVTTNSPGNKLHISDARSSTNKSLFYRARNGP